MRLLAPQPGLVLHYSYLWTHEHAEGRDEGVKDRPCAVVLTIEDRDGNTRVSVVPVTHTKPDNPDDAIEIPAPTKSRLGLDDQRSWIMLTEINIFTWPGPDLRPIPGSNPARFDYGFMPPKLFRAVRDKLVRRIRADLMHRVGRSE